MVQIKQKGILILVVLLSIYNMLYMPTQTSILTLVGSAVLYGLTRNLMVPAFVLFVAPLIVFSVKMYKEGFQNPVVPKVITATVTPVPTAAVAAVPTTPVQEENAGSTPAPVTNMSTRLVVADAQDTSMGSVDVNPKPQRALITGADTSSVKTALARELPTANQEAVTQSVTVGPSSV
jgi:hypothetical protein